jgi:prepilin-type N-terminal cleavage/methylation domain-containing protein
MVRSGTAVALSRRGSDRSTSLNLPKRLRSRRAFSFAELLVVMIIIGILSGLAVPRIRDMKRKSYLTTLITDLRNLAGTQEQHWTSEFEYSNDFGVLKYHHSDMVTVTVMEATEHGWSAIAVHMDLPISCAVFFGNAAALPPATESGAITCG